MKIVSKPGLFEKAYVLKVGLRIYFTVAYIAYINKLKKQLWAKISI